MTSRLVVELKQIMTESGLRTFLAQLDGVAAGSSSPKLKTSIFSVASPKDAIETDLSLLTFTT
jgi:hypothetical protein